MNDFLETLVISRETVIKLNLKKFIFRSKDIFINSKGYTFYPSCVFDKAILDFDMDEEELKEAEHLWFRYICCICTLNQQIIMVIFQLK